MGARRKQSRPGCYRSWKVSGVRATKWFTARKDNNSQLPGLISTHLVYPIHSLYSRHHKTPNSLFSCYSKCNEMGEGWGKWKTSLDEFQGLASQSPSCSSPTYPSHREVPIQGGLSDHPGPPSQELRGGGGHCLSCLR